MTRAHDRQKTLPTPASVHVVRVDPQRLVGTLRTPIRRHFAVAVAVAVAASRARPCSAPLQPWYEPTTRVTLRKRNGCF